jgi:hypothetical protein
MKGRFQFAVLLFATTIVGCNASGEAPSPTIAKENIVTDAAAEIIKKIGLNLPASARFNHAAYEEGVDDSATLIVTLPRSDWEQVKQKPPFAGAEFARDRKYYLGPDSDGWEPSKIDDLPTAQISIANGKQALNVGVEGGRPAEVRLFIFWHQL